MPLHKNNWVRAIAVLTVVVGIGILGSWTRMGGTIADERLSELGLSPNWQEGQFRNINPQRPIEMGAAMQSWLGDEPAHSTPEKPLLIVRLDANSFDVPPESGLRVTWLGHSTVLIEIDGYRVLLDPMWGSRASPMAWMGPQRFHDAPLALADLPPLDAIVISHDHYDHLDHETILHFRNSGVKFITPLGVGEHLKYWGIEPSRITELDWWGAHRLGDLRFVALPARHNSGRTMAAAATWHTLWAGWAIISDKHRVYYSGDSAMFPAIAEIGKRFGPFDVTLIDSGAYNQLWADNHMGPEQAVKSHQLVRGKLMIPVHWGTFYLAPHSWVEPVERVVAAAKAAGVQVATPRQGESIEPGPGDKVNRWWPNLPWRRAADYPIVSSGIEGSTD
jgi:L-ascorbate metabolism protein UlaG (beta-lactamase superfamily)